MATPFDPRPRKWTKPGPTGRERSLSWVRQQAAVRDRLARFETRAGLTVLSSREWTRGLHKARARIARARAAHNQSTD